MNQDQIKELRRLAEAATRPQGNMAEFSILHALERHADFSRAADPSAIIALLDHIATLEQESAAKLQRALAAEKDASRWQSILELDGGSIYHLLGDYDGIRHEVACQAIDSIATNPSTQSTAQQNVSINGVNIDVSKLEVG